MQKMKESFVVKVIAYILILLCMMVTVFSGILIYINAVNQWYTKGRDAYLHDIYKETLTYACYELAYAVESYETEPVTSEEELLYGERDADGFAYTITKPEKDQSGNVNTVTVREVHPELVEYAKESNGFDR